MPKVKFTLDGVRGLVQEIVPDDNLSELTVNNLDRSVYATKDYVDTAVSNVSGSGGGNVSLTGSNIFGSSASNTHQFTGSVSFNNGLTGSLFGTASFSSNADLLDGLNSTQFARIDSSNTYNGNQIITGSLNVSQGLTGSLFGTASFALTASSIDGLNPSNIARTDTSNTFNGNQIITGSLTTTQFITASITGSNINGTNITGVHVNVDYVDFNTSSAQPSFQAGRLYFDQNTGDLQYNTIVSNVSMNIGQQIVVKVKNTTNTTVNKGKLVRISGGQGSNPLIATASYENDNNSANTLGMVMNNIAHNGFGYVLLEGVLEGIDLNPNSPLFYSAGQVLYLSSSGDYTNVAPTAPKHTVRIGEVITAQQNNGVAFIRVQNGYELNELHDTLITSASNGDLISFNSSDSTWRNTKALSGSYQLTGSLLLSGAIIQNRQAATKEYVDNTNVWTRAGSVLSPITAGDSVLIDIDLGITGLTVEDVGNNASVAIAPANVSVVDTLQQIELDALNTKIKIKSDTASVTTFGTGSIEVIDENSNPATLNLNIGGLALNNSVGIPGQVLTSQGSGSAPIWTTISGGTSVTPTGVIFVAKNGSNSNSGSLDSPVLTIGNALTKLKSHVSGAANLNRAIILVAPGTYTENITIEDKNVIISGMTNDKEDQAVQFVGNITIHATGSRGSTLDSVGIHNIKINDLSSSTSHLISLTGSASNANGIFLTLQNVLVAKVNSASSNASGLFIDTSFSNRVRIQDCRFLDQNGGGSPLVHFKNSGLSASIDIYDTKFECSVASSNLTAGSLIKTEGNCFLTAVDRCIFDTNSLSGAINIGAISALSAANISNCSIITTNTGSNGIKIPVNTNIVAIRNVFTVTGSATNICISGSSGGLIAHAQNIATPTVFPAFNYSTVITGSNNKIPYTAMS